MGGEGHNRKVRTPAPGSFQPTRKSKHRLTLMSGLRNLTQQKREVEIAWQSRGGSAYRSGKWGNLLWLLTAWPWCTHLEYGLSHRPTQSLGLLQEAREVAFGRELGKA